MARRLQSPIRQGPRRLTSWAGGPDGLDIEFSGDGASLGTNGFLFTTSGTIVRIRGLFSARLESSTAAGDGFRGAFGLGMVTQAAFNAGVASLPHPFDEVDWDGWMYHRFFDARDVTATHTDGANAVAAVQQFEIDSKAMRKFEEDGAMVGVIQVIELGTATIVAAWDTRILAKLH